MFRFRWVVQNSFSYPVPSSGPEPYSVWIPLSGPGSLSLFGYVEWNIILFKFSWAVRNPIFIGLCWVVWKPIFVGFCWLDRDPFSCLVPLSGPKFCLCLILLSGPRIISLFSSVEWFRTLSLIRFRWIGLESHFLLVLLSWYGTLGSCE